MAGHAQLKIVITECSKTQIRLTGLNITSFNVGPMVSEKHSDASFHKKGVRKHKQPGFMVCRQNESSVEEKENPILNARRIDS